MPKFPSFAWLRRVVGRLPRRRLALVLVVVLAGAGAGGWFLFKPDDTPQTQSVTQTVTRGTYKTTVSATGTITPVHEADLSFSSSGVVTQVKVAVGDRVAKGDVLAKIDDAALIAQRDAAQAQVTAAATQLSEDSGSSSSQLAADRASLASAQSQLTQARDAVLEATLTAPFAGMVSAVGVDVGDPAGGSSNQPASTGSGSTAAVSLISPKKLLVEANVSAADVSTLKKGMQAEITPTGGGAVVYGTLTDIGVIATASDSGAAQFPVTIAVTGRASNRATGLYPGSSAAVEIVVRQATDVLTVPTQALHTEGDKTFVYVVDGGKRTKTTVTLGASYGMQTEILTGLTEGDTVEVLSFTRPNGSGNTGNSGTFNGPPGGGEIKLPAGGGGGPVVQVGP